MSPNGAAVYVTGSRSSNGDSVAATVAYDPATGGRLWVRQYDGGEGMKASASAVAVGPDGSRAYVAGRQGDASHSDMLTIAYDAATGAPSWQSTYGGVFENYAYASAVGVSPDGGKVFVAGTRVGRYQTLAYDAVTGRLLWRKDYDPNSDDPDYITALAVDPAGSKVYVTGVTYNGSSYSTIAYDASDGTRLWIQEERHDVPASVTVPSMTVSPDGSKVFVTGSEKQPSQDYLTIAYDTSTGVRLWRKNYDGGGGDISYGATVSPDGSKVYVTGGSIGDYATVAYDASTGGQVWVQRYYGCLLAAGEYCVASANGYAWATAIGVSQDGSKVYVTGASTWRDGLSDYATIAYDASG